MPSNAPPLGDLDLVLLTFAEESTAAALSGNSARLRLDFLPLTSAEASTDDATPTPARLANSFNRPDRL